MRRPTRRRAHDTIYNGMIDSESRVIVVMIALVRDLESCGTASVKALALDPHLHLPCSSISRLVSI